MYETSFAFVPSAKSRLEDILIDISRVIKRNVSENPKQKKKTKKKNLEKKICLLLIRNTRRPGYVNLITPIQRVSAQLVVAGDTHMRPVYYACVLCTPVVPNHDSPSENLIPHNYALNANKATTPRDDDDARPVDAKYTFVRNKYEPMQRTVSRDLINLYLKHTENIRCAHIKHTTQTLDTLYIQYCEKLFARVLRV